MMEPADGDGVFVADLPAERARLGKANVMGFGRRTAADDTGLRGDELAVVLIESDQDMAQQVAERIETHVREDQEEPRISVSIGMAIYPADGRTAHELLEAADRQLYRRKKLLQRRKVAVG